MKRIASLFLVLTLMLSLAVPVSAADTASGTTLRLSDLEGTVTVKDAAGKDKSARADMRLYNGYTVATGKSSSVFIKLDDTKAVKLDRSSKVEIKQNGKQLEVALLAGQVYFNVDKPLSSDETLNISTATMVTGVRGSFGWVSPNQAGMVHGHGTVTYVDEETGKTVTTPITSGEGLSYKDDGGVADGEGGTYEKTPLTVEDIPAIVAEQIAADPEKQAQVDEVENLNTQEIIDSVEQKKEEEEKAEEEQQNEADKAAAEQEKEIAANDAADKAAGVTNDVSFPGGGSDNGGSSDSSGQGSASRDREPIDPGTVNPAPRPQPQPQPQPGEGELAVENNLGTYNIWLTGAAGLSDYVGDVSAGCSINSSGANETLTASLYVNFNFYQNFTAGAAPINAASYPTIRMAFTPTATLTGTPTITAYGNSSDSALTVSTPVRQGDGSWVVTCNNPLYQSTTETYAEINFSVRAGTESQRVGAHLSIPSNGGESNSQWTSCETWDELEALLSPTATTQYYGIDFNGTAPLDRNLTIPASPRVDFNHGLTVSAGKTLTFQGGQEESNYSTVAGDLTNNGTIVLSGNCSLYVRFISGSEGTPTLSTLTNNGELRFVRPSGSDSSSYTASIDCSGVKLVNSGTITGSGSISLDSATITGAYDDGVERVDATGAYPTPNDYSHDEMKRPPASTVSYTRLTPTVTSTGTIDRDVTVLLNGKTEEPETTTATVTFNANGGTGTMRALTFTLGNEIEVPECTFTNTGKFFVNWNTKADGSGSSYGVGDTPTLNGDTTFYAQWSDLPTVTFDANGGTGTMRALTFTPGDEVEVPGCTFTNTGKFFVNWNTKADGSGSSYGVGDTPTLNGDTTFYAQWADPVTVTFDLPVDATLASADYAIAFDDDAHTIDDDNMTVVLRPGEQLRFSITPTQALPAGKGICAMPEVRYEGEDDLLKPSETTLADGASNYSDWYYLDVDENATIVLPGRVGTPLRAVTSETELEALRQTSQAGADYTYYGNYIMVVAPGSGGDVTLTESKLDPTELHVHAGTNLILTSTYGNLSTAGSGAGITIEEGATLTVGTNGFLTVKGYGVTNKGTISISSTGTLLAVSEIGGTIKNDGKFATSATAEYQMTGSGKSYKLVTVANDLATEFTTGNNLAFLRGTSADQVLQEQDLTIGANQELLVFSALDFGTEQAPIDVTCNGSIIGYNGSLITYPSDGERSLTIGESGSLKLVGSSFLNLTGNGLLENEGAVIVGTGCGINVNGDSQIHHFGGLDSITGITDDDWLEGSQNFEGNATLTIEQGGSFSGYNGCIYYHIEN